MYLRTSISLIHPELDKSMQKHIQILGILHIIYSAFGLLAGAILFILFLGIGTVVGSIQDVPGAVHEGVPAILFVIGLVIGTLLLLFAIPGIIAGVGLLNKKEWGRILALVVGFFDLLHIPFGTMLGVYTIWALMNDEVVAIFRSPSEK
jgi:hypothetical protein